MSARAVYTGDGSQTAFQITFNYLRIEDVKVYVNGLETSWTESAGFAILDPAPSSGASVIVMREQDTTPLVTFTSTNVTASNINTAVIQALYAIEDAVEGIAGLTGIDGDSLPLPVANDKILVSRPDGLGGYSWQAFDVSEILPVLGDIPNPTAGRSILVTAESTDDYELITPAALSALLGAGSSLPTPVANQFVKANGAATGYELVSYSAMFSGLGLGTSARKNTGTSAGQIPLLEDVGGNPGLPAVDGSQLTGIATAHDYAVIEGDRTSGNSATQTDANVQSFMDTFAFVRSPSSSPWAVIGSGVITLQPGRYRVSAVARISNFVSGGSASQLVLKKTTGVGDELLGVATFSSGAPSVDGVIRVAEAASYELRAAVNTGTFIFTNTSSPVTPYAAPDCRITLEKLS